MWSFKKKIKKAKVFCSECKHYKYYTGDLNVRQRDDCYVFFNKKEEITLGNTPITRSHTFTRRVGISDAQQKNRNNDCEDYQPLFGDLGETL